jgi:hypothetical protein
MPFVEGESLRARMRAQIHNYRMHEHSPRRRTRAGLCTQRRRCAP